MFIATVVLYGSLALGVKADPPPESYNGRSHEVESVFADDMDPTLSASTAAALNPLGQVPSDYLAVLGILAASVFLSLRKRPQRMMSDGR